MMYREFMKPAELLDLILQQIRAASEGGCCSLLCSSSSLSCENTEKMGTAGLLRRQNAFALMTRWSEEHGHDFYSDPDLADDLRRAVKLDEGVDAAQFRETFEENVRGAAVLTCCVFVVDVVE